MMSDEEDGTFDGVYEVDRAAFILLQSGPHPPVYHTSEETES